MNVRKWTLSAWNTFWKLKKPSEGWWLDSFKFKITTSPRWSCSFKFKKASARRFLPFFKLKTTVNAVCLCNFNFKKTPIASFRSVFKFKKGTLARWNTFFKLKKRQIFKFHCSFNFKKGLAAKYYCLRGTPPAVKVNKHARITGQYLQFWPACRCLQLTDNQPLPGLPLCQIWQSEPAFFLHLFCHLTFCQSVYYVLFNPKK